MRAVRTGLALLALAGIVILAGCGADPAFTSGKVYLADKNYDKAIEQLKIAIKNAPVDWRPHMYLGMAYADTDELEKAHDEFFGALDLAQDDPAKEAVENALTHYWLVYDKEGERNIDAAQFELAIGEFEKAIVIDPRKADAYINLGYALHMSNEYDRAVEVFEAALDRAPDNPVLKENLVNVYETKAGELAAIGDYDNALRYFGKIEGVNPDYLDLYYNIGLMHYQNKDYREGLSYFTKHLEKSPDDEEVLYRVFLAHWALAKDMEDSGMEDAALDEHSASIEPLQHLIDLNDKELTYHRALARVLAKLGREDEAMHELKIIEELLKGDTEGE
jgi:tetratricopeptide (TPR) repeat protein